MVERALEIADGAEVIMLLRLAFLATQDRYEFWQKHPVSRLLVLSARPSFTGSGSDYSEYAWFIWSPYCKDQHIEVIDSPTRPGKRKDRS